MINLIGPAMCLICFVIASAVIWFTMRDMINRNAADAERWRNLAVLRGVYVCVAMYDDDDPRGYYELHCDDKRYKAVTIDVAIAQALNDLDRGRA